MIKVLNNLGSYLILNNVKDSGIRMNWDEFVRSFLKDLLETHEIRPSEVILSYPGKSKDSIQSKELSLELKVVPPKWFNLPSKEYPIVRGKEVIMECKFRNSKAHVFTSMPYEGTVSVGEVLNSRLNTIPKRSIFYCALNSIMRYFGLIKGTIHCRGKTPEICGKELLQVILSFYGNAPTLLIGYQPGFVEALAHGLNMLYITDMDPENIGKRVGKVVIQDHKLNEELIRSADLVISTGSSLINSTFWNILDWVIKYRKKFIVYGVTIAGVAEILKLRRHCPYTK